MKDIKQEGGDDGVNLQAGRDISNSFVYIGDADPARAMEIARTVAQWEIDRYHEAASTEVERRLTEFREELIERIDTLGEERLATFNDPDVQMTLREAHHSYARSGRADVRRSLIDLVATRCSSKNDGFQAAVVSDSIDVVRKLSPRAISILTTSFVIQRAKAVSVTTLDELGAWISSNVMPFIVDVPRDEHEYFFLESTRTATIGPIATQLSEVMLRAYGGLLQAGITREQIPDDVWIWHEQNPGVQLIIECLHDSSKFQVNALGEKEAEQRSAEAGFDESVMKGLLNQGRQDPDSAMKALSEIVPGWSEAVDVWSNSLMQNVRLTSTGIAIAHSNWSNRTGGTAPLSIWIPDD